MYLQSKCTVQLPKKEQFQLSNYIYATSKVKLQFHLDYCTVCWHFHSYLLSATDLDTGWQLSRQAENSRLSTVPVTASQLVDYVHAWMDTCMGILL